MSRNKTVAGRQPPAAMLSMGDQEPIEGIARPTEVESRREEAIRGRTVQSPAGIGNHRGHRLAAGFLEPPYLDEIFELQKRNRRNVEPCIQLEKGSDTGMPEKRPKNGVGVEQDQGSSGARLKLKLAFFIRSPGPISGEKCRILDEQGRAAWLGGSFSRLERESESGALSLQDHFLSGFDGIEEAEEVAPSFGCGNSRHVYSVRLPGDGVQAHLVWRFILGLGKGQAYNQRA